MSELPLPLTGTETLLGAGYALRACRSELPLPLTGTETIHIRGILGTNRSELPLPLTGTETQK